MADNHYNEPWSFTPYLGELLDAQLQIVMRAQGSRYDEARTARLLRRVVICVNACAGLPDFVVEQLCVEDLWRQQHRTGRSEDLRRLVQRYMNMVAHDDDPDELALAICDTLSDLEPAIDDEGGDEATGDAEGEIEETTAAAEPSIPQLCGSCGTSQGGDLVVCCVCGVRLVCAGCRKDQAQAGRWPNVCRECEFETQAWRIRRSGPCQTYVVGAPSPFGPVHLLPQNPVIGAFMCGVQGAGQLFVGLEISAENGCDVCWERAPKCDLCGACTYDERDPRCPTCSLIPNIGEDQAA